MDYLKNQIQTRESHGDNVSNNVQNDAVSKVHHAMESAEELNREKNRQFLREEFELQEESIESLGNIDIEHENFKLLVRSLQNASVKNLQAIIQDSGTAKQADIIRILQKYPSFVIEDYQRSIDFFAKYERSNIVYNMGEFLEFLVRIFDIQSMNELMRTAHQEHYDVETHIYQQMTRKFLMVAYLCQNREEYLQWKNFELDYELVSLLGSFSSYDTPILLKEQKINLQHYLSQISSFSEFLKNRKTHNFHFYKEAIRREKSYN